MGESPVTTPVPGVLRVRRGQGFYRDHFRRYWVRIDGSPAGELAEGEARDFFVPPGEHRVRLTIDRFWTSREVVLQVHGGELAEFSCRPSASALMGLVFMVACPRRYIRLDGPLSPPVLGWPGTG